MTNHTLITCIIGVTILTLTPGLDTMLIIRNSGRGGWRDGATSSLGICSGLFVHATLSALGISVLLLKTAWAFTVLKYVGGAYLVWLGLGSWNRLRKGGHAGVLCTPQGKPDSFRFLRSFREGFLSNVLNPKTILFYMAFLPQFIDPKGDPLVESLMVAGIHFGIAMVYQCSLAAMVEQARGWLQSSRVNRVFDGLTGSVFIYLGLRLAGEKLVR